MWQNEGCSPGDGVSDSSSEAAPERQGDRQSLCDFGEHVHAVKHIFSRRVMLVS